MKLSNPQVAINDQQVTRLLSNLYISIIINQLLGTILVILVKDHKSIMSLAIWYSMLTMSTMTRIFMSIKFKARQKQHLIFTPRSYQLHIFVSGFIWGLSSWFLYPENYIPGQMIIALMVMGLIGTSALALNLIWKDVVIYNLAIFVPFLIKYIYEISYINAILVLIILIFSANIIYHAKKTNLRIKQNAILKKKLKVLSSSQQMAEHELLSIFENVTQNLILLNPSGKIVRANPKALISVGLPLDADLSKYYIWHAPWWKQDENSQEKIKSALKKSLSGEVIKIEVTAPSLIRKSQIHEISIAPIYKNNKIEFIFLEGRDITPLKLIQDNYTKSTENFHQITMNMGECIWETDLNGYYQFVNKNCIEIKKIQAGELIGKRPEDFMLKSYAKKYTSTFTEAIKNNKTFEIEVQSMVEDDSLIWEKIVGSPLKDENGDIVGIRGVSTNITAEKNQQIMLIQSKEAAEAGTRAKSQFLAIMSHEIRTPMNGVIGMAELLLESELDEQQRQYANTIVSSGNSLLQILNDILDLSKIEAGKLSFELKPVNLRKQTEEISQLIRASYSNKSVKLILNIDERVPETILGDETRLKQILVNLLSNACKFTKEGTVQLDINLLDQIKNNVTLQIKVIDSGIGISEYNLARIFDNFTQADASTSRKYGGTGLGLSVTKELIELMGGSISVKSKPGEGTTFIVDLNVPIYEQGNSENIASREQPELIHKTANILLVEDNLVNQKVATSMLAKLGYNVELAINGQEALDLCETKAFDLILMDCQMPVIDGYEATLSLRASRGFNQSTPIIAMTANAMTGDREKCIRIGMNDYLAKPVSKQAMAECLQKYI